MKVIADIAVPGVGRNDGSIGGEVRGHLPPLLRLQGRVQLTVQVILTPEILEAIIHTSGVSQ